MGKLLLKDVIREHQLYSSRTRLKNNLGDGYLYEKNRLFRNVRNLTLAQGFSFTTDDFCDYRLFSLAALPAILKKKQIPYHENFKPLAKLEKTRPGIFEIGDMVSPLPNYVLHESCHAIAHSILSGTKDRQGVVLRSMLGESLANAVDYLIYAHSTGRMHQHFISINSYMSPHSVKDERGKAIRRALKVAGPSLVFKTVWISFLYANFLYQRCTREDFENALTVISRKGDLSADVIKALFPVFEMAVPVLEYGFRLLTTEFYFRLSYQFDESIFELTDFDFIAHLKKNGALLGRLDSITDALIQRR